MHEQLCAPKILEQRVIAISLRVEKHTQVTRLARWTGVGSALKPNILSAHVSLKLPSIDETLDIVANSATWIVPIRGLDAQRLRVGLVRAGLIGQAEHAFYLSEERERFDFIAFADALAVVRQAAARYGISELHPDIQGLLRLGLDAVVIAASSPFHHSLTMAALDAGSFRLSAAGRLARLPRGAGAEGLQRLHDLAIDRDGFVLVELGMKSLLHAMIRQNDVHPRLHAMARQAVAHTAQRAAIDGNDRPARGGELDQRRNVAADPGDAGHLRLPGAVEAERHIVCHLRGAGAAGAGINQRKSWLSEAHRRALSLIPGLAGDHSRSAAGRDSLIQRK
jgi:hypothetical protein